MWPDVIRAFETATPSAVNSGTMSTPRTCTAETCAAARCTRHVASWQCALHLGRLHVGRPVGIAATLYDVCSAGLSLRTAPHGIFLFVLNLVLNSVGGAMWQIVFFLGAVRNTPGKARLANAKWGRPTFVSGVHREHERPRPARPGPRLLRGYKRHLAGKVRGTCCTTGNHCHVLTVRCSAVHCLSDSVSLTLSL